jgi:hypothetical protein
VFRRPSSASVVRSRHHFKSQVRVFSKTSPDFFRVRVRVFLESGFSSRPSLFRVSNDALWLFLVFLTRCGFTRTSHLIFFCPQANALRRLLRNLVDSGSILCPNACRRNMSQWLVLSIRWLIFVRITNDYIFVTFTPKSRIATPIYASSTWNGFLI